MTTDTTMLPRHIEDAFLRGHGRRHPVIQRPVDPPPPDSDVADDLVPTGLIPYPRLTTTTDNRCADFVNTADRRHP
ncbi:hypothetical protein Sme01_19360 [Sphaerisporangium melleum]|uniref:Uncharacterized protein n=1 Tax=Sphaerisporangium melleum TaxID=321316 RepID=A0A917RF05_9ACTN|nr:hypothetical protein [Sphaerisporangium melleum]GGL02930.1 hypothetical protein GCM10007964_51280 [Sphaerisporangium melleum]GII69460.1 hypothetical protein Sme01_19360 [Sphaerisporangium melleum]